MLFSNYARRVDDYLEYCRNYFTAMQQLGAKVFVLHGNKVPAASVNKDMYFTRFRRLAELGESYGVQVAQENVARCTSASLPFLLEMRDALGKQARFVLDIKQAVRSGEDPSPCSAAEQPYCACAHKRPRGIRGLSAAGKRAVSV